MLYNMSSAFAFITGKYYSPLQCLQRIPFLCRSNYLLILSCPASSWSTLLLVTDHMSHLEEALIKGIEVFLARHDPQSRYSFEKCTGGMINVTVRAIQL